MNGIGRFLLAILLVAIIGASCVGCASDAANIEELRIQFGANAKISNMPNSSLLYIVSDDECNIWFVRMTPFANIDARVQLLSSCMRNR